MPAEKAEICDPSSKREKAAPVKEQVLPCSINTATRLILVFICSRIGMSLVYILLHIRDTLAEHEDFYEGRIFRNVKQWITQRKKSPACSFRNS